MPGHSSVFPKINLCKKDVPKINLCKKELSEDNMDSTRFSEDYLAIARFFRRLVSSDHSPVVSIRSMGTTRRAGPSSNTTDVFGTGVPPVSSTATSRTCAIWARPWRTSSPKEKKNIGCSRKPATTSYPSGSASGSERKKTIMPSKPSCKTIACPNR